MNANHACKIMLDFTETAAITVRPSPSCGASQNENCGEI